MSMVIILLWIACDDPSETRATSDSSGTMTGIDPSQTSGEELVDTPSSGQEQPGGEALAGDHNFAGMFTSGIEMNGDAGPEAGMISAGEENMGGDVNEGGLALMDDRPCLDVRSPRERLIAIGFPFSEVIGEDGQDIGIFRFDGEEFQQWGARIQVGFKPASISFSHDGQWVLALSEEGHLASISISGDTPVLAQSTQFVGGYFSSILPSHKPNHFDLINSNNDDLAGIYELSLECDGEASLEEIYLSLRLTQGFARFNSDPNRALVYGGQALFDPIDPIDIRIYEYASTAWTLLAHLDLFNDHIDAINVALSPNDTWAVLVNGSPFSDEGGYIHILGIDPAQPSLTPHQLFDGFTDVRGAWFSPNGSVLLVTQFQPGIVQPFRLRGENWTPELPIDQIGLANELVFIPSPQGNLEWWAIIPSTSPSGGSELALLLISEAGEVSRRPSVYLGDGFINIPDAIAAWPLP